MNASKPIDLDADYSRADIEMLAGQFGMTIEHFVELGLPEPDYYHAGVAYWREENYLAWQTVFHTALATCELAADPARFKEFVEIVQHLQMESKGGA
ncbi:MAG: hypothetical protein BroJett006_09530 [Betaproteobacteria bacterium]|nr:MAG: hypothetical protein BroJett006_09530 [Betaproteobacteria bacterium]